MDDSFVWNGGWERNWLISTKLELADTPATGEREALSAPEERILAGECVLLEDGAELDLDGNGTKERIGFGSAKEVQIGAWNTGTDPYSVLTGRVYGVCLDAANPAQIHLLIELLRDQDLEGASSEPFYELFTYRQMDGFCYTELVGGADVIGQAGGVPFAPQEWSGLSEAGSLCFSETTNGFM